MKRINTDIGLVGETGLTKHIISAAYAVSNALGCGFLEKVYENAMAIELRSRGHRVKQQCMFEVRYRDEIVGTYEADMIVDAEIIVELKAARPVF